MGNQHITGRNAEEFAKRYLIQAGFDIIATNYRYRNSEIDIITQKGNILHFVEVKMRANCNFGHPESFVTPRQIASIKRAADAYIFASNWTNDIQFDIIALIPNTTNNYHIDYFPDAF